MQIDDLLYQLHKVRKAYGNIEVALWNETGTLDDDSMQEPFPAMCTWKPKKGRNGNRIRRVSATGTPILML